jgi:hypothetical protein
VVVCYGSNGKLIDYGNGKENSVSPWDLWVHPK